MSLSARSRRSRNAGTDISLGTDGRSIESSRGRTGPYAPVTLDQFVRSVTVGIQRGLDCVTALEVAVEAAPWAAPYIAGAGTALATLCYAFPTVHEKITAAERYLRGLLTRVL